jgi:hypothetical protein
MATCLCRQKGTKRLILSYRFLKYTFKADAGDKAEDLVPGWKLEKLYKYQAAGWTKSGNWAVGLTCRDNHLGTQNCDVRFVPINIEWLMKLYNGLLWKPANAELSNLLKETN